MYFPEAKMKILRVLNTCGCENVIKGNMTFLLISRWYTHIPKRWIFPSPCFHQAAESM